MSDARAERLAAHYTTDPVLAEQHPSPLEWATAQIAVVEAAGLAVRVKDDDGKLADQIKDLIFERTQLVDGDAYDLAWDMLNLLQGESNG